MSPEMIVASVAFFGLVLTWLAIPVRRISGQEEVSTEMN